MLSCLLCSLPTGKTAQQRTWWWLHYITHTSLQNAMYICQDPVCGFLFSLPVHAAPHPLCQTERVSGGSTHDPLVFLLKGEQFVMLTSTNVLPRGQWFLQSCFHYKPMTWEAQTACAWLWNLQMTLVDTSNILAHFEGEAKKLFQWWKEHFLWTNVRKTK